MQRSTNLHVRNVVLIPIAAYSAGAAAVPFVYSTPIGRTCWEIIIYSLFLSPCVGILALWRILKGDRSLPIIITALLGLCGTLSWAYTIVKRLTI